MKTNFSSVLWGIVLMLVGGFVLAKEMGYLAGFSTTTWMLIFAGASLLFFITYFVNGFRAWTWLFPACIFAALSGTLFIVNSSIPGEWVATLVVGSVAIPFVVAFLLDRSRMWALIPAFILTFVAFIPPLSNLLGGDALGAFIVALLGLPFIAAHFITPKAWWGIIPGGILLSIALMIALSNLLPGETAVAIMFVGWMLTFGLLWLKRNLYASEWAKYPAIVMGILALIMFFISYNLVTFWAIALIVAGVVMLVIGLRQRPAAILK